jgi:hypothetical protein
VISQIRSPSENFASRTGQAIGPGLEGLDELPKSLALHIQVVDHRRCQINKDILLIDIFNRSNAAEESIFRESVRIVRMKFIETLAEERR